MRLAILGGSFNPVHNGHINIGKAAYNELSYDRILFIPAYHNPHKERITSVSDTQRVAMLHLALKNLPWAEVDTCELERGGRTFTIETINYLTQKYRGVLQGKIGFILGDDLVKDFSRWRNPGLLAETADLIVAHRLHKKKCFFNYPHTYLENPLFRPSSTEVRASVRMNDSTSRLVPVEVAEYIVQEGLYG